jgi:hypothetical protein
VILPVKVVQSNERVAEVQFVCDCCGKLVRTSLISKEEAENQVNTNIKCWQCKQEKAKTKK